MAAGYVIIAPDYEGLGTPGVHPYLNLSSEAKSALAAVKAAKEHYGTQLKAIGCQLVSLKVDMPHWVLLSLLIPM